MSAPPLGLRSEVATRVYFIQEGADGPIKIGIAENPDQRLVWLQCGNPEKLYLRGVMVGGLPEERVLHELFAAGHIRGEWFKPDTPGLEDLISAANHEEFWPEDDDLCQRCNARPVARHRRKYCERCA